MTASCLSLHQLPAGEVERNGGTHVVDNNTNDNDRHCARGSQRHSRCCWRRCDQSMKRRAAMAHSRVQPFNAEADATDARPPSQRPTTLPHRHMTDSGATAVPRCSTCDAGLCDYNAMQLAVSDRASISQSLLSKHDRAHPSQQLLYIPPVLPTTPNALVCSCHRATTWEGWSLGERAAKLLVFEGHGPTHSSLYSRSYFSEVHCITTPALASSLQADIPSHSRCHLCILSCFCES
jgi:hypothetical protein